MRVSLQCFDLCVFANIHIYKFKHLEVEPEWKFLLKGNIGNFRSHYMRHLVMRIRVGYILENIARSQSCVMFFLLIDQCTCLR
jgi:hypothetical protein